MNNEKGMEYLFVHDGTQWWLKFTDVSQIIDYHKKTAANRYEGALRLYFKWKMEHKSYEDALSEMTLQERIEIMDDKDFKYLQCALIQAEKAGGTILDGFRMLTMETGASELDTIHKYGAVFINPVGGHTHGIETVSFCRRKELIFPNFKKEDIRVKQFQGGQHWYAYIGDMQVRDKNQLKWNTQAEAQAAAEKLVKTADF